MSTHFTTNPETGQADAPGGRFFQSLTGKSGPTAPRLPQGFGWMGPTLKGVGQEAAGNINYGPSHAAENAGQLGSAGGAGLASGVGSQLGGVSDTFGGALGSIGEGMSTGYLPDLNQLDAVLRPGLERGFATGAADIREQNALTGNLASSGAGQQITDYRAQLENQLGNNVAGIYGNALPAAIGARSGATALGANLPGMLQQGLFGNLAEQGLSAQQFPLQALGSATSAISGAPFSARQGSGGNGAVGSILSAYMGGK